MSKFDLKDKVAIVTGGAGGIGAAIARAFSEAGAKVVVSSRNQENIDKVAAELKASGGESLAVATDVTIPEQVDNMIAKSLDTFGRIDILVNNAGGAIAMGKVVELSLDGWNATVDLNLTGTFLCAAAAGKVMIGQKSGKVINISSVAGIKGSPNMAPYAASKAGVIALTRTLALEWAPHNIHVNCIAPGLTATPGLKSAGWIPSREKEDGTQVPSLLHPGDPERVADLALFLASPASDHLSGELIPIRGLIANDQ
jgi:NAD(P)-dependent dehydrogenase (short-subunit alcohol dehydrogenase family)